MRIIALPTLLTLVAACDGASDVDATSRSAFCRAAADTACAAAYACLTEAERAVRDLPPTEAECRRASESSCEDAIDYCVDDTHAYDSVAAATCLDDMARAECNDAGEPWLDAASCAQVCALSAGAFAVEWQFDPPYYVCANVGVVDVRLVTTSGGDRYTDLFSCDAGAGVTAALPLGDYDVRLELLNASGVPLFTSLAARHRIDSEQVVLPAYVIVVQ